MVMDKQCRYEMIIVPVIKNYNIDVFMCFT